VTMLVPRRELRLRPGDAARLVGVRIKGDRGPGPWCPRLRGTWPAR
jgi:hypothetical protein